MNAKKTLPHLIILSLFVSYLFFANYIWSSLVPVEGQASLCDITIPDARDDITYYIGTASAGSLGWKPIYTIRGWAFVEGAATQNQKVFIILSSEDSKGRYSFNAQHIQANDMIRPDDNSKDLENTGFEAHIPVGMVEDGRYAVGICIESGESVAFTQTDKIVTVEKGEARTK